MSTSQKNDHDQIEEEQKTENSLFQTELSNPKISSSEQPENDKDPKQKIENEEDTNEKINQEIIINANLIKDTITNNYDSQEKANEEKIENDLKDECQFNQNVCLTNITTTINNQLTKDNEPNNNELPPSSKKNEIKTKTSNIDRNKNKRYSYIQEIKCIPDSIKYNKFVENRYGVYTGTQKSVKIPKAAMSKKDYHAKEPTKLDDLTLKLLNGDEEVIQKIRNSRKINPNLNNSSSIKKDENNNVNKATNRNQDSDLILDEKSNNENPDDLQENENKGENSNENQNHLNGEGVIIKKEENNNEVNNNNEESSGEDDGDDDNLPTLEDLKRTAGQLREFEKEMISKGNYADAKKASLTLQMVNKEIYKQQNFSRNKGTIEQLVSKRNELKALLNSTTEEFDNMIIDHEQNTISKLDQIALQQQQELEEFDKNIPKDLPPLFKRNSVSYLKMRSKEKYLALTRDFDEAMSLQKKADVIEKEEEQLNFEKMDQYYRSKRKKLIMKQRNAIENYIQYSDMRKGEMLNLREVAIRGTTNRIKNLENQIKIECEKRGIRQSEINYDIVDESRIELIKRKENENPISYKRTATSKSQRNNQTPSSSTSATFTPNSPLSQRNSTTNSQSSIGSRSSLTIKKPRIKTPSSLSYSVDSKRKKKPNKPIKTAKFNNSNNNVNQSLQIDNNNNPEESNITKMSEIGVNTKTEDENTQLLNSEENGK